MANMHPQLLVKGVGFDRLLGGFEIDVRLQQHLAKVFVVRYVAYKHTLEC